jgi:L-lactate dehydrogenase complex protein LldG
VKDDLFAADAGVTGVDAAIAETGSLVAISGRERARSVNLLPPLHITLVDASQLLPDLFDWFEQADRSMPACATLITGPSKTGDIELRLVTGVHGPGKVHVVFLDRSM